MISGRQALLCLALMALSSAGPAAEVEVPELRIHRIRALDVGPLMEQIQSVVPGERLLVMPQSRSIAVYAGPSVHRSIGEAIDKHEAQAILIDRLDADNVDPQVVIQVVASGMKAAKSEKNDAEADSPQLQFDRVSGQFIVRGLAREIEFVRETINGLSQHASRKDTSLNEQSARTVRADPKHEPPPERSSLRAPSGPVRIVPVKGLDLLLIRGRRADVRAIAGE